MEELRGKGRNEWPVSAMWNSLVASLHSIVSLIRELNRDSQLRIVCGFQRHFHTGKDSTIKLMFLVGLTLVKGKIEKGTKEYLARFYA